MDANRRPLPATSDMDAEASLEVRILPQWTGGRGTAAGANAPRADAAEGSRVIEQNVVRAQSAGREAREGAIVRIVPSLAAARAQSCPP